MVSLPLVVNSDGDLFLKLADVLGTGRFPIDWDFRFTPLFPFLLNMSFAVIGRHSHAITSLNCLFGFLGCWLISAAIMRLGRPLAAGCAMITMSVYPTLVAYEHSLLAEAGTFFFISLMLNILLWDAGLKPHLKSAGLILAIALGYYFQPMLLCMAPVTAAIHGLALWNNRDALSGRRLFNPWLNAGLVMAVPFIIAIPWLCRSEVNLWRSDVFFYGVTKQVIITTEDPILGSTQEIYRDSIRMAAPTGHLNVSGLILGGATPVIAEMQKTHANESGSVFFRLILKSPRRYLGGITRSMLLFAGYPGMESENNSLRDQVIQNPPGAKFNDGPPESKPLISAALVQKSGPSFVASFLCTLAPVYNLILFFGSIVTFVALAAGVWRLDYKILAFSALPLAFMVIHALLMLSVDRFVFPVYPLLLANLILLPDLVFVSHARTVSVIKQRLFSALGLTPDIPLEAPATPLCLQKAVEDIGGQSSRRIKVVLALTIAVLAMAHVIYLCLSRTVPSCDEAHYLTGAWQIAEGARSGSPSKLWQSFVVALHFKAPLICIPAAILMLISGGDQFAGMLSLVLIFIGLSLSAFVFFRHCMNESYAATATVILVTMPMITGLTHRFYVEGLLLALSLIYLHLLLKRGWNSFKWSGILGVILGLGALCKLTFLIILFPPSLYLFYRAIQNCRAGANCRHAIMLLFGRAFFMVGVGFLTAWTWYFENWRYVVKHSGIAFNAGECAYPEVLFFLTNISLTHVFVFALAILGSLVLARIFNHSDISEDRRQAWRVLLLMAATTLFLTTIPVAKVTRYTVTWLPGIAGLAVLSGAWFFRKERRQFYVPLGATVLSIILFFHNSFAILAINPIRIGDLRLLDSSFPLNVPDWFDDNHPVDRRDFRQAEAEAIIADDAARNGKESVEIRTLNSGLIFTHDYFHFLSRVRGHSANYLPWYVVPATSGPRAPDYFVYARGMKSIHYDKCITDWYPNIESDVASAKIDYELLSQLEGPANVAILTYRKVPKKVYSYQSIPPKPAIARTASATDELIQNGCFETWKVGTPFFVPPRLGPYYIADNFYGDQSGQGVNREIWSKEKAVGLTGIDTACQIRQYDQNNFAGGISRLVTHLPNALSTELAGAKVSFTFKFRIPEGATWSTAWSYGVRFARMNLPPAPSIESSGRELLKPIPFAMADQSFDAWHEAGAEFVVPHDARSLAFYLICENNRNTGATIQVTDVSVVKSK